jgi:putative peptidoglycan lipid II flippase
MSLVALFSGVLNSLDKFVESSSVSIVLNLTLTAAILIAMALGYRNEPAAGVVLAWGVFAAGLLQLALLIWGLNRNGVALRLRRPRWTDDLRQLVTLGIPGVIAGGITQVNILVGTMIASLRRAFACRRPHLRAPLASSASRSASCFCRTSPGTACRKYRR